MKQIKMSSGLVVDVYSATEYEQVVNKKIKENDAVFLCGYFYFKDVAKIQLLNGKDVFCYADTAEPIDNEYDLDELYNMKCYEIQ